MSGNNPEHATGADRAQHSPDATGERRASGGRRSYRRPDDIPNRGMIVRSSIAQTIMAVAFLILVTLISFLGVALIGDLIAPTQVTYWMIELIFALLCGGAGALVGGSAAVRSTLRLPGTPVHATLGGAISMIIVGFAVAYLGRPATEEQMYALEIHNLPERPRVGEIEYQVFVASVDNSNLLLSRDRSSVSIKIPPRAATYKARIAIFRPIEKDRSRTFARCDLTFETHDTDRSSFTPMQLVPARAPPHFHLFLSDTYIEKAVKASLHANAAIENEPCIEGIVASKKMERTPLSGRFTLLPTTTGMRVSSIIKLKLLPRYAILASDVSNIDPQDTLPDLPPGSTPLPGTVVTAQPAPRTGLQAPPPPILPRSATSAQPAASDPSTIPALPSTPARPAAAQPPPMPQSPGPRPVTNASQTRKQLSAQVDAYIRGEDLDRTQLYQSWNDVADYVIQGFRSEFGKESKFVAQYLNLISNALNVIEDGKYLPPTRRPDWDQSTKPDRLLKNKNIPGFESDDYKKIVALLCSKDEDVRRAAQRLLKLYPSNNFYPYVKSLPKQGDWDKCSLAFVSETAVNYFYNRIVEYDGTFALDKDSRAWIDGNYKDGLEWVRRAAAENPAHGIFSSMIDYARGLVLWDHGDHAAALPYFNQMLDEIRSSGGVYPSNPQHIATALKLINEPRRASRTTEPVKPYGSGERRSMSRTYALSAGMVSLFALPDGSSKQVGRVKPDATARMYLRSGEWDLLQAGDQIGWARRQLTSASN